MKLLGIISVNFDVTHELLIIHSVFVKHLRKKLEYRDAVRLLFVDFKKAYASVTRGFV
jgi:hypothetical protein